MIRRTDIPALDTAAKMREATPLFPFMLLPETDTRAVFFKHEIPRTGPVFFSDSNGPFPILVPRALGFWLLRLHASIPFAASGARVFGCSTFEPKNESSIASSYVMS